jgi:hypothetical protein
MNASEQWKQIAGAFRPDCLRELPRDDFDSAPFADAVDNWGSLIAVIATIAILIAVAEGWLP